MKGEKDRQREEWQKLGFKLTLTFFFVKYTGVPQNSFRYVQLQHEPL